MSWRDYAEPGPWDDDEPDSITCSRCGKTDLEWRPHPQGWRLVDAEGHPHHCKSDPADDFKV